MIDISEKENVRRSATAYGEVHLNPATITLIKERKIKKGDVFETSKIAGITGAKLTSALIPNCHQIPLTSIETDLKVREDKVIAQCTVRAIYRTGVEMEALNCVSTMLLNVWDMVKYLEKDETGNYPNTFIDKIRVIEKRKD